MNPSDKKKNSQLDERGDYIFHFEISPSYNENMPDEPLTEFVRCQPRDQRHQVFHQTFPAIPTLVLRHNRNLRLPTLLTLLIGRLQRFLCLETLFLARHRFVCRIPIPTRKLLVS